MNTNNEKKLFNRKLNNQKLKRPSISKIPKCISGSKNIPIPKIINIKNKKSLLPLKQISTSSLKNTNYIPKKNSSGNNIPLINSRNIYSSLQNYNQTIISKKNLKYNFQKRMHSSENSNSEKHSDSIHTNTNRKKINIDQIYNLKIEYYLIKEKIQKILGKQVDNINIDIYNKLMKEIIVKLKKISEKTNEHLISGKIKDKLKKETNNKKMLNLYVEKYNKINKRLKEINTDNYIEKLNIQIEEIQNEINHLEKENKDLLINNVNINTIKNYNTINLPNIQKTRSLNNININLKKEKDLNLEKFLYNKINEYKLKISQDLSISRKIKDNELNLRNNEEIIKNLNIKYNILLDNFEKGIYKEENTSNQFNSIENNIFPTINNNSNFNSNINSNLSSCFNTENNQLINEKERDKDKHLNELNLREKRIINMNNHLNDTITLSKELNNKNIITENGRKFEDNILSLPHPKRKKNLSCANVISNENNSKRTIKEIILKNLDLKEKEEKTLINVHENNFSSNKYKHIKLKPNFSFNNDYHLFKDERINKIPKMQSSVENKNNAINLELYNNNDKNKEEQINESINIEESSNIKNCDNEDIINLNNNNINEKNKKKIKFVKKTELFERNKDNNIKKFKPNRVNDEEKKNDHFSINVEQREKVLNTIMYDDIVEQGSIL